jgi:hypothetical protein
MPGARDSRFPAHVTRPAPPKGETGGWARLTFFLVEGALPFLIFAAVMWMVGVENLQWLAGDLPAHHSQLPPAPVPASATSRAEL